jgi:hypothetical protein
MISAFGVLDLDDLMPGADYLKACGGAYSGGVDVTPSEARSFCRDPSDNKIPVDEDAPIDRAELAPHSLSQAGPRITPDFLR